MIPAQALSLDVTDPLMVRAQHIVITLAEDLSAINMDAKFVQTKTNPRPLPDLDRVI